MTVLLYRKQVYDPLIQGFVKVNIAFTKRGDSAPPFLKGDTGAYALTLWYRSCDFSKLSPSPFPLPSREGDLETLSPGGRGRERGSMKAKFRI